MIKIRKIIDESIKSENIILRKVCTPVSFPLSKEDEETAQYLIDYLKFASKEENDEKYDIRPGVGLAAPQLGITKRMIGVFIEYFDEDGKVFKTTQHVLINPEIISHSVRIAYLRNGEGCLSVKNDREGFVPRSFFITVKGYDYLTKKNIEKKFRGYEAIVLQHEIDHLNGILYIDHINKEAPWKRINGAVEI